jgi:DNA recombination protein RmuC
LRRVVEMAGMLDHCDFVEQVSVEGEEGRLRPDVIVRLPGGRNIVVDAKTPLSAYLEAVETQDDAARKQFLVDHARQVRDHMTKLGRKSYQDQFDSTPELVVLFLPGEMFFSAALEQDPELIEFGVGEKVLPATPTTLIAMLRAIAYGWKQELGRDLHERVAVMAGHWSRVGKNLHEAVGAYNKAVASLETRVLVSTRKFKELKAVPDGREIAELEPVDLVPRAMQAPELAGPVIAPLEAANAGD